MFVCLNILFLCLHLYFYFVVRCLYFFLLFVLFYLLFIGWIDIKYFKFKPLYGAYFIVQPSHFREACYEVSDCLASLFLSYVTKNDRI